LLSDEKIEKQSLELTLRYIENNGKQKTIRELADGF